MGMSQQPDRAGDRRHKKVRAAHVVCSAWLAAIALRIDLSTLQSDRGASHLGLFILRPDRDRLLVALRHQIHISAKRLSFRHDPKAGAFDLAG